MSQSKLGEQFAEHRSHDNAAEIGSDRSFGVVFTIFFAVIGCLPLISGGAVRVWALGISGGFLLVALVMPKVLHPLNVVLICLIVRDKQNSRLWNFDLFHLYLL